MPVRARRGIEALAILLVILLGVSVLLPLTAAAAAQVTGFISTCGGPATPVPGATVALVDANGIAPPATATTDGGGVYIFAGPPPASYTITANQSAYYGAESGTPVRFDGSVTKRIDLCMYPHGTPTSNLAVTVLNGATPVPGAKVAASQSTNPTNRIQLVAQGTTGTTGVVNLTLWDATFQLRTSAALLPTVESSVIVSGPTSSTVNLSPVPLVLFGHVQNVSGAFLGSGVVAWLYNPLQANTSLSRLIPGTVTASFFQFETARVPSATYTLIVDANGYLSSKESITIPGVTNPHDVTPQPAPQERYGTTVAYGTADWNNLTAWRNLTLNADSTLPALGPANLRDLRLQIDSTLGNGDGSLSPQEITAFQAWVCSKGPAYVATDGFFTTNGHAYNSTAGPCGITVSPTLTNPNGGVWINTTTATPYKIKQAPPYLTTGAKTYFVNMTMVADSNASAYQNYTYTVVLPKKYELNTTTVVPTNAPVTTQNFTRFTVDPGVTSGKPQIRMTVSQSRNGTARAKVIAPAGKFYVQNATFTNYQAYVANNTNLTFSAGDSTDPNDHVTEANFTWRFTAILVDTRYGISPVYRYRQNGTYNVSLVMRETGGNVSFRNVTLYVDDQLPVAKIRTNRTGSGNANGVTLKVDQGIVVRFDGALSTDFAYPGTRGGPGNGRGQPHDVGSERELRVAGMEQQLRGPVDRQRYGIPRQRSRQAEHWEPHAKDQRPDRPAAPCGPPDRRRHAEDHSGGTGGGRPRDDHRERHEQTGPEDRRGCDDRSPFHHGGRDDRRLERGGLVRQERPAGNEPRDCLRLNREARLLRAAVRPREQDGPGVRRRQDGTVHMDHAGEPGLPNVECAAALVATIRDRGRRRRGHRPVRLRDVLPPQGEGR